MNTNIKGDFQICISVPFMINFFFNEWATNAEFYSSSHKVN